ncbi:MAG: hypothetical protein KDI46_03150 [Alphaproteobacteria bacterium]|nr:hypothetical protein [Alphaproteobacteria bacterium]
MGNTGAVTLPEDAAEEVCRMAQQYGVSTEEFIRTSFVLGKKWYDAQQRGYQLAEVDDLGNMIGVVHMFYLDSGDSPAAAK